MKAKILSDRALWIFLPNRLQHLFFFITTKVYATEFVSFLAYLHRPSQWGEHPHSNYSINYKSKNFALSPLVLKYIDFANTKEAPCREKGNKILNKYVTSKNLRELRKYTLSDRAGTEEFNDDRIASECSQRVHMNIPQV